MSPQTITKLMFVITVISITKSSKIGGYQKIIQNPNLDLNEKVITKDGNERYIEREIFLNENEIKEFILKIKKVDSRIMEGKEMKNLKREELIYFSKNIVQKFSFELKWGNSSLNSCNINIEIYKGGEIGKNFEFIKQSILCIINYYKTEKDLLIKSNNIENSKVEKNAVFNENSFPKFIDTRVSFIDIKDEIKEFIYNKGEIGEKKLDIVQKDSYRTQIIFDNNHVVYYYDITYVDNERDSFYNDLHAFFSFFMYKGGNILENLEFKEYVKRLND